MSGSPALDLTGTVGYRRDEPVDALVTPADLEKWIAECEELPDEVSVDKEGFERALALREAIYRLAHDRLHGQPFNPANREIINQAASAPEPTIELGPTGAHIYGDLSAVLSSLARSGISVLADPDSSLKECGRASCTRLYLDRSRGARRTWCGMDQCGNRVKAAAYRARQRAISTQE